jgi:hypothetical protein
VRREENAVYIGLKRYGYSRYRVLRIVTLFGNPRLTCEDIIKMDLKQNGIPGFTWLRRRNGGG